MDLMASLTVVPTPLCSSACIVPTLAFMLPIAAPLGSLVWTVKSVWIVWIVLAQV
jgi:hypothetical protein